MIVIEQTIVPKSRDLNRASDRIFVSGNMDRDTG